MTIDLEKTRVLASQLAEWDKRIVEITTSGEDSSDLICRFEPEPEGNAQGYFWIANLLTRMEFELDIDEPFYLGFQIGEQVFLPNGEIRDNRGDHIVVWPKDED